MSKQVRYGYMDKTDFEHEVGEALGGNKIYPCIADLIKHEKCASSCGIVRVKIELEEVLLGSDYRGKNKEEANNKIQELIKKEREGIVD